jgi:hypothetical protein
MRHITCSIIAGIALCVIGLAAAVCGDDAKPSGAPPEGEVTHHTFDHSKIFPGTVRDYWVYVPKQYASTSARSRCEAQTPSSPRSSRLNHSSDARRTLS